jgi:hypothetical protein
MSCDVLLVGGGEGAVGGEVIDHSPLLVGVADACRPPAPLLARRIEPEQPQQQQRIAILVYPSYAASSQVEQEQQDARTLVNPLADLPVDLHLKQLRGMLERHGFCVQQLDGWVTAEQLLGQLRQAAWCQPEVLVLVFCGHGIPVPPGVNGNEEHGMLRPSGGHHVRFAELRTRCSEYRGTFLRFLNMCHAAPMQPMPGNAPPHSAASSSSWATQGQQPCWPSPAAKPYRWVDFYACEAGETVNVRHADSALSLFLRAEGLGYLELHATWPPSQQHELSAPANLLCTMGGLYGGTFPGPAEEIKDTLQRYQATRSGGWGGALRG